MLSVVSRGLSRLCGATSLGFHLNYFTRTAFHLQITTSCRGPLTPSAATLHTSCSTQKHYGILVPYEVNRSWALKLAGIDPAVYTHEPLPYVRTGGRGPNGRVLYKHIGGGLKRPFFMVDYKRHGDRDTGQPLEERVLLVKKTWWRHPYIALVASGEHKRWIIATKGMSAGDLVRSYSDIPKIPVTPRVGDAHCLGALPVGTAVCCVEQWPGAGASLIITAGGSGQLTRGLENGACMVRLPSKREVKIRPECTAVVGQISNETHSEQRFHKFGEKRWRGIRQRSGLWQRKTGRFGRKLRPVPRPVDLMQTRSELPVLDLRYTLPWEPTYRKRRPQVVHAYEKQEGEAQPLFQWCSWTKTR